MITADIFHATLHPVPNRGVPPAAFLLAIVAWASGADESLFAPNDNPADIFSSIRHDLGPEGGEPWTDISSRRAALMEVMRVHAGFESSWHWGEGVDVTNRTSMTHPEGEETGIFQVSFDSTRLGHGALMPFAAAHGIETASKFIPAMKADHALALEYYARLVRVNIAWAGPLVRREINPCLSRAAASEFANLLTVD